MLNLLMVRYSLCWVHGSLGVSPAMEAGITDTLRDYDWLTEITEDWERRNIKRKKPGPKPGTKYKMEPTA